MTGRGLRPAIKLHLRTVAHLNQAQNLEVRIKRGTLIFEGKVRAEKAEGKGNGLRVPCGGSRGKMACQKVKSGGPLTEVIIRRKL